jgi:hypothetical protein
MLPKSDFKKLSAYSRWFDNAGVGTRFLVGVTLKDKSQIPNWLKQGMRDIDGLSVAGDPNYIVSEAIDLRLEDLDDDDNVSTWGIIRKCGLVEFTDDQIWAALLQHHSEFNMYSKPITETREEFQGRDPIGYDESMAGMERVLYKALGYI